MTMPCAASVALITPSLASRPDPVERPIFTQLFRSRLGWCGRGVAPPYPCARAGGRGFVSRLEVVEADAKSRDQLLVCNSTNASRVAPAKAEPERSIPGCELPVRASRRVAAALPGC